LLVAYIQLATLHTDRYDPVDTKPPDFIEDTIRSIRTIFIRISEVAMDDTRVYDRIVEEYRLACTEYEEATRDMVSLASQPDCSSEDFKALSDRVSRLARKLGTLRSAMGPMFDADSLDGDSTRIC
jgi:hypothetical protein